MGLFRRSAKGRHALGAAVTSIPSGPAAAAYVPASAPAAAAAAPSPAPAPAPAEPDVMTSIAELIATGEAWATGPVAHGAQPPVVAEPPAPAAPPVAPAVLPAPAAPAVAPSSLEAALAELLPPPAGEVPTGPPVQSRVAPRVQLGFRDGSSTTLEPGSSQSRALAELAQSLTRRD